MAQDQVPQSGRNSSWSVGAIRREAATASGRFSSATTPRTANSGTPGAFGTGLSDAELERVWRKLQALAIDRMLLAEKPPKGSHFGRALELSKVH